MLLLMLDFRQWHGAELRLYPNPRIIGAPDVRGLIPALTIDGIAELPVQARWLGTEPL